MMKSTKNRQRSYAADELATPEARRIFVQRQMGSDLVVVGGVSFEDPPQVPLAEHDDVVQALVADRADRALDVSVVPRRVPDRLNSARLSRSCDRLRLGAPASHPQGLRRLLQGGPDPSFLR